MTLNTAVPYWPFDATGGETPSGALAEGADGSNSQSLQRAIADAQGGGARGFEVILQLYGRRLYGFFYRATGDSHDAEDLVNELMLRLIRRLKHYQHRDRFEPWLFRIAANMARDRIRGLRSRPTPLSLSRENDGEAGMTDPPCRHAEPLEGPLARAERNGQLQRMLDQLDPTTRGMILLRYFGDMSFRDLAETFACPIGTALAKVHRGLQFLRERAEHPEAQPSQVREKAGGSARTRRSERVPNVGAQAAPFPA
ncbi:MAG: RNA polymerase sigma factor [Planctomycetota bacterium]|nr:RNA polymerase sigma factor [Planctomycetota bacterium]